MGELRIINARFNDILNEQDAVLAAIAAPHDEARREEERAKLAKETREKQVFEARYLKPE